MKIKCNSDDKSPLNNTIKISSMIRLFEAAFQENNKNYSQILLKMNVCTEILYFSPNTGKYGPEKTAHLDTSHPVCLAIISLGSALKKDESYYLQVFLKDLGVLMII